MLEFIDLENKEEMEIYDLLIEDIDFKNIKDIEEKNKVMASFMIDKANGYTNVVSPVYVNWVDTKLRELYLLVYADRSRLDLESRHNLLVSMKIDVPQIVSMWVSSYFDVDLCVKNKWITFEKSSHVVFKSKDDVINHVFSCFKDNHVARFYV